MKLRKIIIIFSTIIFMTANISAQTGGDFTITQSVIAAGGGQQSAGGTFSLDGTSGQSLAGTPVSNGNFSVASGFWTGRQPVADGGGGAGRRSRNDGGRQRHSQRGRNDD